MSNADDLANRFATKINRMNEVLRKTHATRNPIAEELGEAWIDVLNVVIEREAMIGEFTNQVSSFFHAGLEPPTESGI